MAKKLVFGTMLLILLILTCSEAMLTFSAAAPEASKIKIYVGPTSVLADHKAYNSIFVQLQDSRGTPARAKEDTLIRLSSSLTNVGNVDPTITIQKGDIYTSANFYSTYTPGTTTITAAASGYLSVQASITTVGPIPSALAVYGFPPNLPADGGAYNAIVVQLQDSSGSPAPAPIEGVQVTLSSSNATVGMVDPSVIISEGSTYAVASIKTTLNATGAAVITAIASGYSSKQATITAQQINTQPTSLKVYVGPPKVLADGKTYEQVVVQLQNASGKISQAPQDIVVTLSSSTADKGTVEETITIPQSKSYALAKFSTTYMSGTTTITAAATNCTSNQATLTTVGPIPSKLAVYCVPSALPADGGAYEAIQVQLQDSRGKPAKDPAGDITVYLFSSVPDAGNVSSMLTIPFGETHVSGTFFAACSANSTMITAQTSGYESGQGKITTSLIDPIFLDVSITADAATVKPEAQTTIRAYVAYNGSTPALRATVKFSSNKGGNFSALTEEGNGYYTAVFTAPKVSRQTVCTITANATKTGYNGAAGNVTVTVELEPTNSSNILRVRIAEDDGTPVSGATISSEPTGNGVNLNGITNETGYVSFANVLEGTYTIQITKEGYDAKTETIQFVAGQTSYQTVNVSRAGSSIFSLPVIIGIVVAVVAVIVVLLLIRSRQKEEPMQQPTYQFKPKGGRKKLSLAKWQSTDLS